MFSRKSIASFVILAFCLLGSIGCSSTYAQEQAQPARAPLYYYIAVDNSLSYGQPKVGRSKKNKPPKEVFDSAKNALHRQLTENGVLQEGDILVGISPFTDESRDDIKNYLAGNPIEVRSDNVKSLPAIIQNNLELIQLRRGDYQTYYGNILDKVRREFRNKNAAPDQQVCIILTDERGGEITGTAAVSPEQTPDYFVIKLEAKAVGNGALAMTTNEVLSKLPRQKSDRILDYVNAIRANYRPPLQVSGEGLSVVTKIIYVLVFLVVFVPLGWLGFTKYMGWDWRGRKQAANLRASYNPDAGKILLQAEQFRLPGEDHRYWLDKGGEIKNVSPEEGSIEPAEELPPGSYEITVQPESGPAVKSTFTVGDSKRKEPGLRAIYKARGSVIFLKPHDCQLPKNVKRYDIDEGVEIESVDAETGEVLLARPLQAGHHWIRVLLEDGQQVKAFFDADPPPPPMPGYSVSVARLSDIGKPRTVELTGREINLLDEKSLKASIWVKRDDHYLYIRTSGNVQKEDGTPVIGKLQLALGDVVKNPILLELEDDEEDVEIAVQKL